VDALHYDGCYYPYRCGANYVLFPVAMQWNFFVARRWSVFGEPGVFLYKGFLDECVGLPGCVQPPVTLGMQPAIAFGARYRLTETAALTMRFGYPTISVGVSFM
jgi:hypothetical protein